MWAEKQGYDAVFISCNLDIGLYEARQLVDIPVTATLESAALVAHMMGAGYSLVTVDHQNGKIQEMLLKTYGLHEQFVSQRPFDIDANDLYPDQTPTGEVIEAVVEAARACAQEDGADVVIPGCTLAGSVLTHDVPDAESVIGAPVLDGDGIEGNYNLGAGDQPAIRGDVMAFWTMTDTATPSLTAGPACSWLSHRIWRPGWWRRRSCKYRRFPHSSARLSQGSTAYGRSAPARQSSNKTKPVCHFPPSSATSPSRTCRSLIRRAFPS